MGQSSNEAKAAWLERNKHRRPEINRNWKLRNVYGITPEQFDQMYEAQSGKCAICEGEIAWGSGRKNDLHVDHNHETNYVRGLLCGRCNLGIGQFNDRAELLDKATRYLRGTATPEHFVFAKVPNPPRQPSEIQKEAVRRHATGNKHRQGIEPWNKGKPWSEESRRKMSESALRRHEKGRVPISEIPA